MKKTIQERQKNVIFQQNRTFYKKLFKNHLTNGEKGSIIIGQPTNGPLVKRLRRGPLKAETWVRFPYGSPTKRNRHSKVGACFFLLVLRTTSNPLAQKRHVQICRNYCSARGSYTSSRSARGIAVARRYTKRLVQILKSDPHFYPRTAFPYLFAIRVLCWHKSHLLYKTNISSPNWQDTDSVGMHPNFR